MERISHFRLSERLGAGGMGTVYRAVDLHDGSEVALKVLRSDLVTEPGYLQRFRSEAQIAARLRSPHIVRVLSSGADDDQYFIAMELVEGQNLEHMLGGGPLGQEEVVSFGRQIALSLVAAHKQGIVHRDIKPQNVIVTPSGIAKVTDFGVARFEGQSGITGDGLYLGTPEYMSPEQIHGGAVDIRADIYSLGIVMYQMLAGRVPFRGETPWKTLDLQLTAAPTPISSLRSGIDPWLDAVVMRCLAKRPLERYQTPEHVIEALDSKGAYQPPAGTEASSFSGSVVAHPRQSPRALAAAVSIIGGTGVAFLGLVLLMTLVAAGSGAGFVSLLIFGIGAFACWAVVTRRRPAAVSPFALIMQDGSRFALARGVTTVGRDPRCNIVVADPAISRLHALLIVSPSGLAIEDTGSNNGTLVNREPVQRASLRHGDMITLGNIQITIETAQRRG